MHGHPLIMQRYCCDEVLFAKPFSVRMCVGHRSYRSG